MRRFLLAAIAVVGCAADVVAQDDSSQLVEIAIKEEVAAFSEINARFEKGKLKTGEGISLFGKKSITKAEQRERMAEIAAKVEIGEASFRALDPVKFSELKLGTHGCLIGEQRSIQVMRVVDADEFLGSYQELVVGLRSREWQRETDPKRWLHFKGVKGASEAINDKEVVIAEPLIVTSRFQFGSVTTWSLEPLSTALKRVRDAEAKKKKK